MTQRLFIALEPPRSCLQTLAALDPEIPGLRWLPPGQMHLTLSFLGGVAPTEGERLREALAAVRVGPFFLPVERMGVFGGAHPSVVWAGTGAGHPHLFALHKRIADAVLRAGLEPDLKPFRPHITVGRARGVSRAALRPFLRRHEDARFALFHVTGFALFSSTLSGEGAAHTVEMRREF